MKKGIQGRIQIGRHRQYGFSLLELLAVFSASVVILAITAYTYSAIERKSRQQYVEKSVARLRGDIIRATFQAQRGMQSEVKCDDYGLSVATVDGNSQGTVFRFLPPYGELDPTLLTNGAQAVSVMMGKGNIWYRITVQRTGVFYIDPCDMPVTGNPSSPNKVPHTVGNQPEGPEPPRTENTGAENPNPESTGTEKPEGKNDHCPLLQPQSDTSGNAPLHKPGRMKEKKPVPPSSREK